MLSAFTSIILRAKKTVNRILPKQFVQLLAQRAILCIGQRIAHTEVILLSVMLLRESKNIICRNAIDNFGRGQTIDLLFKDMFQPLLGVRERRLFRAEYFICVNYTILSISFLHSSCFLLSDCMIFGSFLIVRILQQCAILILRCLFIVLHVLLCKHQEDAAMNIGRNILYFRQ